MITYGTFATRPRERLLLLRVLPELALEFLPTGVYTFGEPRFAALGADPGLRIFGKLRAASIGTTARATYTFTPRISLQTYGQIFLASGHYSDFTAYQGVAGDRSAVRLAALTPYAGPLATNPDFQQGSLNVNVVFRWEYFLGSTMYVVYTRSQVPAVVLQQGEVASLSLGSVRRAPAADVIAIKLSYWLTL